MRQLLAAVLIGVMVSGCYVQQPPRDAAPPPPPPSVGYPPPPPSNGGYSYGATDYQRGVMDGRAAAERAPVFGYATLGFVLGLVVAPVCLLVVAAGGDGGGCNGGDNCFSGGGDSSTGGGPVPNGPGDYRSGWQRGWDEAIKPRRDHAEAVGFVTGLVVAIAAVIVVLSVPSNRDSFNNHASGATAAPPGAREPAGIGFRF